MSDKVQNILKASFWVLAVSWYSRVLSMLTVIILARNLDKHDFGILAGCFVIQSFFNAIASTGVREFILRKETITAEDINAAWTIHVSTRLLMALSIFGLSGYAADFMKIPEIGLLLKVMSLSAVFQGFQNLAIYIDMKKLRYSKPSLLGAISKSVASTTSISLAIIYQSYWAVVVSEVLFHAVYTIGTHVAYKHKLKFVSKNVFEQWQFSKWIILKGIVGYIKAAFDKIIVSRNYPLGDLGLYNFSMEAATTASKFIIQPLNKLIYPSLSDYVNDKRVLVDKVNKSLLVLSCVYIPIVFGGVYLSDILVPVVFGSKWSEAVPLFNIFLPMTFAGILVSALTNVYTLTGKVKQQFWYEVITSILFLMVMVPASTLPLLDFALCRQLVPYVLLLTIMLALQRTLPISIFKLLKLLFIPLMCSLFMILLLRFFSQLVTIDNDIVFLLVSICIGALAYIVALVTMVVLSKGIVPENDFLYKNFILGFIGVSKRKLEQKRAKNG
ncbi:oligosaccharide flippase family protein [Vibrio algarum]|uniref:Oligosaccharide flippase family protein n=1 Tax=Vibrio algarum TaxID=3020714 RepID=A0ABT4YQ74_9VIBR|nr:oligosaccharide flippase family protein [Vibrio sp. KJ40-1]MDB1123713.1 oligosaccharide flippase family protein [Vibrio sp. KJ40-1]